MYAASFSLINSENSELLALVNLQTNTLDVHRIHDGASCPLQTVGQLSLPFPRTGIPLLSASFRLARTRFPTCPSRPQIRCLPFHPSPDACLLGLTVIVTAQDGTMTFHWLAIRPDCLSSTAETKCDSSSDRLPTPWETWSPHAACCIEIEHPLGAPTPAGSRWLVHSEPLSIREIGRSRSQSRSMQAGQRAHHDQAVGDAGVLFRHGLKDSFPSQLSYRDVPVSMGERKYESVIADYEWVVGMRHEVRFASRWALNDVLRTGTIKCRATILPGRHITSISIISYRYTLPLLILCSGLGIHFLV